MEIKIPNKIQIGCYEYDVEMDKNLGRNESVYGNFSQMELKIRIDSRSPEQQSEQTFIHEAIEAIDYVYNLGLPHHKIHILGITITDLIKKL